MVRRIIFGLAFLVITNHLFKLCTARRQLAEHTGRCGAEKNFCRKNAAFTFHRVTFAVVNFTSEVLEDVATANAGRLAPLFCGLVLEAAVVVFSVLECLLGVLLILRLSLTWLPGFLTSGAFLPVQRHAFFITGGISLR